MSKMLQLAMYLCVISSAVGSLSIRANNLEQCVQSPSRTLQCPNLVYRGVTHPTTGKRIVFCFCRADMDYLLKQDLSATQLSLNKMEWQQLLVETRLTDSQLKSLISK